MSLHSEYLLTFSNLLSTLHTFPSLRWMIFSCYIKMNVVHMSMSFQVVQISVYHPVFTPSFVVFINTTQPVVETSVDCYKTGKHWSEVFGTVLDFCWIKLLYGYSCFLWVFLWGDFNISISNYYNARLISLIITAGYIYIRNKYRSVNQNTWCWGLCSHYVGFARVVCLD